jgi:hypothetical protein
MGKVSKGMGGVKSLRIAGGKQEVEAQTSCGVLRRECLARA